MYTNADIYAQMQKGEPYKAFKKTVPVWVEVIILNPFDDKKTETKTLKGDPDKNDIDCYVPLWSEKEYLLFKRANRFHIKNSRLIEAEYPKEGEIEKSSNNLSDEEIQQLIVAPFMSLKSAVESMTSEAAIYRVIRAAEKAERPEKTMTFLRNRLSVVQSGITKETEE